MLKKTVLILLIASALSSATYARRGDVFDYVRYLTEQAEEQFGKLKEEVSYYQPFAKTMTSEYNDNKTKYTVEVALPGYERKNITVEIIPEKKQNTLIISAGEEVKIEKKKDKQTVKKEKSQKTKIVKTLPEDVKIESCDWKYDNGMVIVECDVEKKKAEKKTVKVPYKK